MATDVARPFDRWQYIAVRECLEASSWPISPRMLTLACLTDKVTHASVKEAVSPLFIERAYIRGQGLRTEGTQSSCDRQGNSDISCMQIAIRCVVIRYMFHKFSFTSFCDNFI